MTDPRAIATWRMRTQRLAGEPFATAPAAVRGLLAVQAENHSQASWAVAARCDGLTVDEFDEVYDRGDILRTHVLRPTWHYVTPDDIRWLLDITRPRLIRIYEQVAVQEGMDQATVARCTATIVEALADRPDQTRNELGDRLAAEGLPASGRVLSTVVWNAELEGVVCSGSLAGSSDHTYDLLERRAPDARRLDDDEAMAELVLRYFSSHGPASERDLAYWATQTLTDIRSGLADVAPQLESFELDGVTYWHGEPPPHDSADAPRVHILQMLDEMYRGYQETRSAIDVSGLDATHRGRAMGLLLVDGQALGDMKRTLRTASVHFDVRAWRPLDEGELDALIDAAGRYGEYLGLPATVDVQTDRG